MTNTKGIILAGGSGTRLHPLTIAVSKQLLPVYDKPMIYYPLSVLIEAGINEILIITTPEDQPAFKKLLGTGEQWGVHLEYAVQPSPDGLAQAFIIGESFIAEDSVCLILGDNIFHGANMSKKLKSAFQIAENENSAVVFGHTVRNPKRYGVLELDKNHIPVKIEEKPLKPKSDLAVVGLYVFPHDVIKYAKACAPSPRGELEITDINNAYLKEKRLNVQILDSGYAWFDMGTPASLLEAAQFVEALQKRQGIKLAALV